MHAQQCEHTCTEFGSQGSNGLVTRYTGPPPYPDAYHVDCMLRNFDFEELRKKKTCAGIAGTNLARTLYGPCVELVQNLCWPSADLERF